MRAIVRQQYGGPEQLVIRDFPDPEALPGHAVIEVKAFGLNHAETYMRKGEWGEVAKVSGIECVGVVKACPSGEFTAGQKVAALMGGMARTINGSYAELTRVPVSNVAPIVSELPWEELAAIPEVYATAWTCLHGNLKLAAGQTIVVRGATSALGQAAVNIAVHEGANVIATTRNPQRIATLQTLGAREAELDSPELSLRIRGAVPQGGRQQHASGFSCDGWPRRAPLHGRLPRRPGSSAQL
jgi:NADPH:quinone reductase